MIFARRCRVKAPRPDLNFENQQRGTTCRAAESGTARPKGDQLQRPPKGRTWLLAAILASVTVLVVLALFEVSVRIANHFFPYYYCYDPDRGWGLRPGASGWWRREGESYVKINHDGLRDREHSKAKPPGTFRIAVLGDSYTQAIQVPIEQTFWSVMERRLRKCPALKGREAEAINFGVDGYSTAQELVTLRRDVWSYHPDAIVLAVFLGNDVRENSINLERNQCRPFYVLRDGRLEPTGPFMSSPSYRLWCLARFGYRSASPLTILRRAFSILFHPPRQPTPEHPYEPAISYNIYKPPPDEAWRAAWDVTEALISEINAESRNHGALLLVATLDMGIQVWPDLAVRQRFMRQMGLDNLFYADDRVAALGRREGFVVLSLARPLQTYAQANHIYVHGFPNTPTGFGHWNQTGHRLAGELIAARLCQMVGAGAPADLASGALSEKTPTNGGQRR
jgi:hypothetical protein